MPLQQDGAAEKFCRAALRDVLNSSFSFTPRFFVFKITVISTFANPAGFA
jgi:hypothetical protein